MDGLQLIRVGLQQASPNEFIEHPDFRQIATFFLGWTFFAAIRYMANSHFIKSIFGRLFPSTITFDKASSIRFGAESRWSEKVPQWPETSSSQLSPRHGRVSINLVFVLTLCIGLASLAQFISLLAFDPVKGDTACAFVTAWSGMAGQSARILGLLKTALDMRSAGMSLRESVALWVWLSIGLIFIFATNAINIGTIQVISQVEGLAFCYRRRFLPVSLVASLIYIVTELYLLVRLTALLAPRFLKLRHQLSSLRDVRFGRLVSLFLLDAMTITSQAIVVSVIAEAIPYAIGALLVLFAFNYEPRAIPQPATHSVPPTSRNSADYLSSVGLDSSGVAVQRSPESSLLFVEGPRDRPRAFSNPQHPYSAGSTHSPPASEGVKTPQLSIQTIETPGYDALGRRAEFPQSARASTMSTDSAVASSVKNAKIAFAFRDKANAPEFESETAHANMQTAALSSQTPRSLRSYDSNTTERGHALRPPPLILRKYSPRQTTDLRNSRHTVSESSDTAETHNGHTTSSDDRHPYSPAVISPNDRRDSNAPGPSTRIGAPSPVEEARAPDLITRERRTTFGEAAFYSAQEARELPRLPVQETTNMNMSPSEQNMSTRATPSSPRPKGPRPRKPSGSTF